MKLKVKRLTKTAKLPHKAHTTDAGFDIFADETVVLSAGKTKAISTGLAIEIPEGYYGRLKGRSGLTSKTVLRVQEGTIDSGYRGEIKIIADVRPIDLLDVQESSRVIKVRYGAYQVHKGEKIAQLIIQPLPQFEVEEVEELNKTERGTNGFGSTGTK